MKYIITLSFRKHCIDLQVLLYCIFLCLAIHAQPPGNPVSQNPKIDFNDDENTRRIKCFDLDIETGLNAIINTDCFQEITFIGKIVKNTCNCTSFSLDINGKPMKQIALGEVPQFSISHQEILQSLGINLPAIQPLLMPIAIGFTCGTISPGTNPAVADKTVTKLLNLTIVADGMEYDKIISKKANQLLGIANHAAVSSTAICCNPEMAKMLSFTKNIIVNNTLQSNVLVSTQGETFFYPNPSYEGNVTIDIPDYDHNYEYSYSIQSTSGGCVNKGTLSQKVNELSLNIPSGLYFVTLLKNGKPMLNQKWVVIR